MRTRTRILTLVTALPVALGIVAPVANADPYPFDCEKQTVLKVDYNEPAETGTDVFTGPTAINDAILAADGDPGGSSVGDTVIVCPGTYMENVRIPVMDAQGLNVNVSVRSWDGPHDTTIIGDYSVADAVVSIEAPGVIFGGSGLGFTISGVPGATPAADKVGIQVGVPAPINMNEDDDQEIGECNEVELPGDDPDPDDDDITAGIECPDDEKVAFDTTNVSVIGNEIEDLVTDGAAGDLTGIAVNNTNNTLVFRNLIEKTSITEGILRGIDYSDTNYGVDIIDNKLKELESFTTSCGTSSLGDPTDGVVGVSVREEALDAMIYNNKFEKLESNCTSVGAYSTAWGGLENDRNGQQIPIATDVLNNDFKEIDGFESAGVSLAPPTQEDEDGEVIPPSSFRVNTNDFDNSGIGVAVFNQLAMYSYVEHNNFDHNEIGVLNTGNMNLDATNNWWGCHEGPNSDHCAESVESGTGTTYEAPWTRKHIDHTGCERGDHAGDH